MDYYFGHLLDETHDDYEPLYVVAAFLSSSHHFLLSEGDKDTALKWLTDEVSKMERLRGHGATPGEDVVEPPAAKRVKLPPGVKYHKLDDINKNKTEGQTHTIHQMVVTDLETCKKEMMAIMEKTFEENSEWADPMMHWEVSRDKYKTALPDLALDILATPASSVPSERMFSICGLLSSGKGERKYFIFVFQF